MKNLIRKLGSRWNRWRFGRVANHVLTTPPLRKGNTPFTVLSMVQHKDINAYLIAIKSFAGKTNPRKVVVVCDPSINNDDRVVLQRHIPGIELRTADEFRHPDMPAGGTWERLNAICAYSEEEYVIQLDADTITVDDVPEVLSAIENGIGFVLGESPEQQIGTLETAYEYAKDWKDSHIQTVAEQTMYQIKSHRRSYVRGCSGFCGFPPESGKQDILAAFSRDMRNLLGPLWDRWGTEQVSSNYLVANLPGTFVLPHPAYAEPNTRPGAKKFIHFIGYLRFVDDLYINTARRAIASMRTF